jgi:hypothetical protein
MCEKIRKKEEFLKNLSDKEKEERMNVLNIEQTYLNDIDFDEDDFEFPIEENE